MIKKREVSTRAVRTNSFCPIPAAQPALLDGAGGYRYNQNICFYVCGGRRREKISFACKRAKEERRYVYSGNI